MPEETHRPPWASVGRLLEIAGRSFADQPAVVEGDLRWDYRTLSARVMRLASALTGLGCGPGSRVAVLSQNSHAVLELHFAVAVVGAVVVPLNPRLSALELAGCLANAGASVVFVTGDLADRLPSGVAQVVIDRPEGSADVYENLIASSPPLAEIVPNPPDVAAIFYTSGSTGRPKGVQLTHDSVLSGAVSCALAVGLDSTSRWLHAGPMFHLADAWAIWAATAVGACHVIQRFDARRTLQTLASEEITHTILVPTALEALADEAHGDASPFSHLRGLLYGGAPISERTYRRMVELRAPMVHTYGSTETAGCIATLAPGEHVRSDGTLRLGVAGRPVPLTEIVIVDPEGAEVGAGAVGEITVASSNLMLGYRNAPDLTAAALRGGRYHTGDLGRVDEDGYLVLAGRLKEMLITGGENVYPNEVELALLDHPGVRDAGVGGLPDDRWGQRVAAVVVPADGASFDLEACRAHLTPLLATYKIPKTVYIRDAVPRNDAGKVDRAALQSLLSQLAEESSDLPV